MRNLFYVAFLWTLSLVFCLSSLPNIDESWNISNCQGCACMLKQNYDQCLCATDCPVNVTNYFYIQNINFFDGTQGFISHSLPVLNGTWIASLNCSYPLYEGAFFQFCKTDMFGKQKSIACTNSVDYQNTTLQLELIFTKHSREIFFWFKFDFQDSSIWQITSLTWVPG